ncbi:MAG: glycoside hydrolase family 16 protein [Burkholderiales bacterium]|nr:glycoside hydrolase family 16 protein [Bacteroidia bacterium]
MHILKFIVCFIFLTFFCHSQVMWQVQSNTSKKWYLQEHDEFTDDVLNTEKWKNGYPWGNFAMSLDLIYKQENLEFKNGTVALITKKEKTKEKVNEWDIDKKYLAKYNKTVGPANEYDFEYSGGAFSSLKRYKFGYFEMRFKANAEKGMWPAFWLFGGNPNEEIDFYEGKGDRDNQIHVDVHCPKGCEDYRGGFLNLKKNWGAWIKTEESLANGWNIISGEWQPNYVKFFLNGQPIGYFEGEFKTAQNLIINNAVAKDKEAFNPGPDEKTNFPNSFLIDYVRVWSQEDTIYDLKERYKLFEFTPETITDNDLFSSQPKKKVNYIYNKKELNQEQGFITLLPVFYNRYSLSIAGKNLGKIQVDVFDHLDVKVAGYEIENTEYYIMDLSALPTGPYKVVIKVLGQELTQKVPVLNLAKLGEEK